MSRLSILLFCCTVLATSADCEAGPRKPNVLFFLADDLGYGDVGCYGSTIKTPRIDRLRAEGMKFTDFYVHNRCSPTRLAFMTGSLADRAGYSKVIYKRSRIGIADEEVTTPELLKKAGYATAVVGKWHLGEWEPFNPTHHGFDLFYGFMRDENDRDALYRNLELVERVKTKTDGAHTAKLLAASIDFIEENRDRPFFLYYASPLPHTKWLPGDRFRGTSPRGTYGDVVREIDWQVGELLDALDERGLTKNTLVVFASDNGPVLGIGGGDAGPLRDGKWTNFEGGIRVPCIMRWPGEIAPGSTNGQITSIVDLLPTLAAMAGVSPPQDRVIDGRNILPYMRGERVGEPIHDTFAVPGSTIRRGRWKLLVKGLSPGGKSGREGKRPSAPAGSLFDLETDPGETTDVSAKHPELVKSLRERMEAFTRELDGNSRRIGTLPEKDTP